MRKIYGFFIITFIFTGILFFISPFFEFPVDDDWVYADAVRNLIYNAKLVKDPFISPTFTLQIFWGSLFSKLFGFSFSILRISTIILSFICIIVLYLILKELEFGEVESVFGSLVLLLNPIYVHLTYSFMTDIPYLAFFFLAIFFFIKALKQDSLKFLIIGEVITVLSFMIRQNGILLYLGVSAYLVIMIIKKKDYKIIKGFKIWLILFLPLLFMGIYFLWRYSGVYKNSPVSYKLFDRDFGFNILIFIFAIFSYLGFFLSPLLLGYIYNLDLIRYNKTYRNLLLFSLITIFIITFENIKFSILMPYLGSTIYSTGVACTENIQGLREPVFSRNWLVFFTFFSSFFASFLLSSLISKISKRDKGTIQTTFLTLVYLIGIADFLSLFILKRIHISDRYFLPLVLPGIVLIFDFYQGKRLLKIITVSLLIGMGIFSIKGMKDCISWNSARWQAGKLLLSRKIPISQIDGGYEWNGWHFYRYNTKNPKDLWQEEKYHYGKILYPDSCKYVVSFSHLRGYKVLKRIEYKAYLGKRKQFIYILRRIQNAKK